MGCRWSNLSRPFVATSHEVSLVKVSTQTGSNWPRNLRITKKRDFLPVTAAGGLPTGRCRTGPPQRPCMLYLWSKWQVPTPSRLEMIFDRTLLRGGWVEDIIDFPLPPQTPPSPIQQHLRCNTILFYTFLYYNILYYTTRGDANTHRRLKYFVTSGTCTIFHMLLGYFFSILTL